MDFNVRDYGAVADGKTLCTQSLQRAIDAAGAAGGGRVVLEGGTYLSGTLFLRSNVELHIAYGAVLSASGDPADYADNVFCQLYLDEKRMDGCFIYCRSLENIAFTGGGTICGNGALFPENGFRPMLLRFYGCKNIRLCDLTLCAPASWTTDFVLCEDIRAHGLRIESTANWNGDGLDFNASRRAVVSDCLFRCSDDCICLQNSEESAVCGDITVTNCVFESKWSAVRIGLLNCGDIVGFTMSNCVLRNIECSGMKIQSSEGGRIADLLFENLVMENVGRPAFITQNRYRRRICRPAEVPPGGVVENVVLRNITHRSGEAGKSCLVLDAEEPNGIRDVFISGLRMYVPGGRPSCEAPRTCAHTGKQAEAFNYAGDLPATGIYARNTGAVYAENVQVHCQREDGRLTAYGDCSALHVRKEE